MTAVERDKAGKNGERLTADFLSKFETDLQPRFDVAEVTYKTRSDGSTGYSLNYIKNAF